MKSVLFVCTGNICRSPMAEGVARKLIEAAGVEGLVAVDSAGTHGYHVGEPPDPRARRAAATRGYDLSALRARQLETADFQRFDLLLAMDGEHLELMQRACTEVYRPRLELFMRYAHHHDRDDVPDPYYGGDDGFERVLDYCEDGVRGLLEELGLHRA